TRHDYEGVDATAAAELINDLRYRLDDLVGTRLGNYTVDYADDFAYRDTVDGSVSENQGIRIGFTDGSRIVYRLSGTGTVGATLRVYLESYEPDPEKQERDTAEVMAPLVLLARELAETEQRTGRSQPDVVT
ncbi:MAG TPA: alpha-D-glucose phosphate-specific phosphoglucomutase, partial [Gammaproteobacteria bacterium]|nr:alpha-D-glucose phosphate-specific phosphoglucomutase [Gammaproteobacteria bacterium]